MLLHSRFAFEQAEPIIDGHKDVFKETLNTIDGSSSTYTLLFHRPVYTYDSQDVELDNEKYFLFARGYQAGWVIEKHNFRAVSSSYYLGCHGKYFLYDCYHIIVCII